MSSTPKEKKRKQQDTSGRPSLQDSKKPKKQIRRSQPAESSHSGKTSPAKHIKPEMPDVLIEDPSSSSSATLGPDSTPSTTTEPEHSPSSSESDRIFSPRTESDGTSYSSSEHASTFFPPSGSDGTSPSSSEHASTFSPPSGSDGTSSSPSESAHSNGTSSSSSESEHTPEPVEQIVLAAEEAAIIHGPIKTAAIRGTLKEYVLQQSRDREPQPFPIPHQQLSTPHNKNNHRGLLDSEVWRVSPTFNRLAVSSFGRFVLDKFFLILQDQFSRRHRHQPSIRFVMNEEEREVHNFPLVAQNLYHIEADEQVLLAFGHRQPTPESQYIIHLDGDFWNCSLDNLRWATHAEFYAHHPFDKRILFSRVASMNFNPRLPWQSDIHNTMYLITRTGDVTSYSKHQGEKIPQGHDAISPVDGLLTKRLEVVNQSLDNQITRTLSVAAMVLDTFRGYNPNAPFIIFEDGDRRNAVLDNLRAATREEYSQHLTETLPTRFAPREVFTSIGNISQTRGDFDLSRYWISNITGKVYSEFYNKLLSYDNQIPYAVIPLSPPNSTRQIQFAIHHLVHNAHVEPNVPGFEIDHIYANTLDVSAANLRMVHPNANIKLAYALDRGKDLRDVTREQLLTGNFNIDDMRDALPEQVPRRTRVPFPAWSDEDIATEIEKGTWSPIVINSEHSGYEVSTRGMVKRINSHRIIHSAISTGGYVYVSLSIEGQTFRRALHTIIARAFIHNDDPNNKKVVDHINRNRTDFSIDNLEWVTFAENSVRAIGVGVDVYDEENDLVTSFCSIRQCAENFVFDGRRYSEAHLQDVSRRRGVLHGGYYLVRR